MPDDKILHQDDVEEVIEEVMEEQGGGAVTDRIQLNADGTFPADNSLTLTHFGTPLVFGDSFEISGDGLSLITLVEGVYTATFSGRIATHDAADNGKNLRVELVIDYDNDYGYANMTFEIGEPSERLFQSISITYWSPAGGKIQLDLGGFNPPAEDTVVGGGLTVQRIS